MKNSLSLLVGCQNAAIAGRIFFISMALLCLVLPSGVSADDVSKTAGKAAQEEQVIEPPPLSAKVKRLVDGLLEIQRSDTLLFDQRGIEDTLGVTFQRKPSKAYARFDITDLPPHLTGAYELGSTFANSLGAELAIYLDTQHVCVHLPQILEYISQPYIRRFILFSAGNGSENRKKPVWPGVRESAWAAYYLAGDNPSEIKPAFRLIVQGIDCISIIEISAMLKKTEGKKQQ